jgi:hypothetical protein
MLIYQRSVALVLPIVLATWMACAIDEGQRVETGELKTESKTVALGAA